MSKYLHIIHNCSFFTRFVKQCTYNAILKVLGRFTRYDFCRMRQAYGRPTRRLTIAARSVLKHVLKCYDIFLTYTPIGRPAVSLSHETKIVPCKSALSFLDIQRLTLAVRESVISASTAVTLTSGVTCITDASAEIVTRSVTARRTRTFWLWKKHWKIDQAFSSFTDSIAVNTQYCNSFLNEKQYWNSHANLHLNDSAVARGPFVFFLFLLRWSHTPQTS